MSRDSLPEHIVYTDRGCHAAPRCLACPLPRCVLDLDTTPERVQRNEAIRREARKGVTTAELSVRYGVSGRQIDRIRTGRMAYESNAMPDAPPLKRLPDGVKYSRTLPRLGVT